MRLIARREREPRENATLGAEREERNNDTTIDDYASITIQ
jgi:hypothetical protein